MALSGTDVIGQAKTGTGKTLGFGLPLLERVTVPADVEAGRAKPEDLTDTPQALVVVPTRELCTQVTNDLLTAGKVRNVRVSAIYGGRAYEPQVEALKKGVDVVVGTPGRLLDLAGQKKLNLKDVRALVLDEADEMLDLGFLPDVERIINLLPARRQTMLFSATMPGAVIGLARRYMSQPTHIRATAPDDEGATVANTTQFVYRAHNMDKPEMVSRILQADGRGLVMVFCRTKRTAADLADQLKQRGFASGAVHGDLGQGAREQALRAFRNGKVDVLVCTDVAARGIDVEGVTHVINYQSPEDEKTYLHRIGRTGRAGAKGTAITLVDWDDIPRWQLINKALDLGFGDPPETYSTSPHLFTDLGIAEGTKGVLPRSERTRAGLDAEVLEDLGEPGGRGGPRGRGGRSERDGRGERGGRGERDDSRSAEQERPARTPRRRRRTRGGTPLGEPAQQPAAPAAESTGEAEAGTASRTPRRRRRMRGGASAEAAPVTAVESATGPVESAEAAVATVEGTSSDAPEHPEDSGAPSKPRRRRTRGSAETAAADTAAPAGSPVEAGPAVAVAPSAEGTAVTGAAPEAGEPEAPAEPRRRRTRKAAAAPSAAETVVDAAEASVESAPEPAPAKPRRTRKSVAEAPVAEAVAGTAEGTETAEAKPRRRTRKAAAAPEATEAAATAVDIPAQAASEAGPETAEAKPRVRRTRKAAAEAETAVDTAEAAEAKPRRTRKAATAVQEPEAAVDAPAEAKPKRTRKTAAAKAADTTEAAEVTEAKPRRRTTRKATAATADPAGIPAQAASEAGPETAEAKPRVRRTRKAAATAPAEPAEA
ncbi:Superfamily II DNA and RNA helicase [Streptomyces prasinopilosus]|uniref:RNA helicase n=1 Tax=Streptomyces prasinopilosus TaxID=67344 RepID=A0A1G6NAH6_9ACTN|nr:Superfamily II DNA and RNA helicase [Streptomyces prasinopilosus]